MKNIKKKIFTLVLLMGLAVTFIGCWDSVCDAEVERYNEQGEYIGWECVTYNNNNQ